jgi:hypothetical protein
MKTLKQICIERKVRKGESAAVTADGAYWLAVDTIINSGGGDGIGQSAADVSYGLKIRHYRSGEIRAYLTRHTWHQNDGNHTDKTRADDLLDCTTIEELRAAIARHEISSDYCEPRPCSVSAHHLEHNLIPDLPEMVLQVAAPDEI